MIKSEKRKAKSEKLLIFFCLLAILAIACFFRFWQLDSIPPGIYPDEAINGNQAISEPGQIFYPENNGREGLFINLIAFSFSVFGASIWSLKIVSAVIGTLTILGLYLLTKELFNTATLKRYNATTIALLSSFFLATSFWHINFSRICFRAILVPFILVFAFYFLFKGFRVKKVYNFILAGIIFGLGFHTYIAFRVAALIAGIVLILWWFIYKKQNLQKQFLFFAFCFALFAFIVALPIGIYFLNNPQDFIGRASGVSIFSQENPIKCLGKSLFSHLAMFNFFGDFNWRHNISGSPILFWPTGILFLIGFFLGLKEIFKKSNYQNKNYQLLFTFFFLFSSFFIMLLPGVLTIEGIPHSLRCIGAIPAIFIFSAIGAEFLFRKIKGKIKIRPCKLNHWLIIFSSVLLAISFIFAQYSRYFILWAKEPRVENAFSKNYVEIGNYLNSLSPEIQKYVVVNQSGVLVKGIPMPAQTVIFAESLKFGKPQSIYLLPENLDKIKINNKNTIIAPLNYDQNLFNELQQKFPNGKIKQENGIWIMEL